MRVRCLSNRRADLTTPWPPTFGIGAPPDLQTDLEPGKEYVVFGLWWVEGVPAYVLAGEHYSRYPKPYPAELFAVTDSRPSVHWRVGHWSWPASARCAIRSEVFIGPEAWVADPGWYELVVDGEPSAQRVWGQYKRLVEEESGSAGVGQ
jgi:hypothetical protein